MLRFQSFTVVSTDINTVSYQDHSHMIKRAGSLTPSTSFYWFIYPKRLCCLGKGDSACCVCRTGKFPTEYFKQEFLK